MRAIFESPAAMQGLGVSCGHHGEILQGAVERPGDGLQRVLVTLPCAHYRSTARFSLDPGTGLAVTPTDRVKALHAARHTLNLLGVPWMGGLLAIDSNVPVGHGLGSSSADVTAAIRAVANAFGRTLPPETIARLAVKAEIASDAVMFEDAPVLFEHHQGVAVESFGAPLPAMDVLGIRDIANGEGVDTIALPAPRYDAGDIEEFRSLLDLLRRGILEGNPELVGTVASASASINQRFLGKPNLEQIEAIGKRHGALGIQVAHSGTVMGLLFRSGDRKGVDRTRHELNNRWGESMELRFFALNPSKLELGLKMATFG